MIIRKTAFAALALSMACLASATPPGELVTHLFPHKDGEAKQNTGGNANDWIEVGRNGTVGWITYKTGGVDLSHTIGSALTLYIDKVYAGGTVKVFALTQPVTLGEMDVEGVDLFYNAASPVATATVALADEEKILRLNLGNLLNQGTFHGLVIEAAGSARVDFGAKESPVQPLIELRYAFATAEQVQAAIDAAALAQAAQAAAELARDAAEGFAAAADASSIGAQGYATLAGQHATAAAGSATLAGTYATQAAGSATLAGTYASQSAVSAGEAANSATAAAGSATAAAGSATAAAGYEAGALAAAGAAATSAGAAAGSATAAAGSATAAAGHEAGALTAAGQAGGYATAAGASAGEASGFATTAGGYADAAGVAAGSCATYAGAAAGSAGTAETAAGSAAGSADAAAAAAAAAEAAAQGGGSFPSGTILQTTNTTPPTGFVHTGIRTTYDGPWATGTSSGQARYDVAGDTLLGKLYISGGYNGSSHLSNMQSFDPATNVWAWPAGMPLVNHLHTMTGAEGHMYAIGGLTPGGTVVGQIYRYNPATNSWATMTPMPSASSRWHHAAAYHDGKIFIFGGYSSIGATRIASTYAYDIATDTWSQKADIPTTRGGLTAATLNGKIHVIGGSLSGSGWVSVDEVYDPATDTWSSAANLPMQRSHASAVVAEGRIYLIGGSTTVSQNFVTQYDPATDSWAAVATLQIPRYKFGAGFLDGKIYVAQGNSSFNGIQSSMEVYTPGKTVYLVEKN